MLRRNPTCCDFALPKLCAGTGRLRDVGSESKIKANWRLPISYCLHIGF